jgi:heme exporter protein A
VSLSRIPQKTAPHLAAADLACRRGSRLLFEHFSLDVHGGQIVWLRGQNGRGKTSLLRLLAGLASPEHGKVVRDGAPLYIGHANALKDDLRVGEALEFLLRIHGRPCAPATVHAALDRLGLLNRRDAPVRTLSQGQRRRVALSRLAVDDRASLWLLDEPFDALDADGVERLNGLLVEHAQRGGSALLTSHLGLDTEALRPVEVNLDRHR